MAQRFICYRLLSRIKFLEILRCFEVSQGLRAPLSWWVLDKSKLLSTKNLKENPNTQFFLIFKLKG